MESSPSCSWSDDFPHTGKRTVWSCRADSSQETDNCILAPKYLYKPSLKCTPETQLKQPNGKCVSASLQDTISTFAEDLVDTLLQETFSLIQDSSSNKKGFSSLQFPSKEDKSPQSGTPIKLRLVKPDPKEGLGQAKSVCSRNKKGKTACRSVKSKSPDILDLYNVPVDSDIYTVPADRVPLQCLEEYTFKPIELAEEKYSEPYTEGTFKKAVKIRRSRRFSGKRKSFIYPYHEPTHMTLSEVRHYLQDIYVNSFGLDNQLPDELESVQHSEQTSIIFANGEIDTGCRRAKRDSLVCNIKNDIKNGSQNSGHPKNGMIKFNIKQTLHRIFSLKKLIGVNKLKNGVTKGERKEFGNTSYKVQLANRALPPLPVQQNHCQCIDFNDKTQTEFALSIERVRDYGWYWGPISSETAEKILLNEPDGSFIVRDSSDDHYIFSLTFKLNNCIQHVRIEQDHGTFSFGSFTKFKSHTIIEFIENAVEHSRSGRYLFFLHRRPIFGPIRVQLLHPVSRFKQTQSLQHMCRFVILKLVRKDLVPTLPLPPRIIEYLKNPQYYSELVENISTEDEKSRILFKAN